MTEQYKNPENVSERNKKISKITRYVVIAALSGAIIAGATGCTSNAESKDPFTRVDPTIESVVISPDARIRSEPFVPTSYDPNNIIETTDATMTIETPGGTVVRDADNNGEWYRIPVDEIKKVDPNFNKKGDSDGFVWVNEQRASVKTSPTQ